MDFIKRHNTSREAGHWVSNDLSQAIDIITKQQVEIERLRKVLRGIANSYSPDYDDKMKITMFRGCVVEARDALQEENV